MNVKNKKLLPLVALWKRTAAHIARHPKIYSWAAAAAVPVATFFAAKALGPELSLVPAVVMLIGGVVLSSKSRKYFNKLLASVALSGVVSCACVAGSCWFGKDAISRSQEYNWIDAHKAAQELLEKNPHRAQFEITGVHAYRKFGDWGITQEPFPMTVLINQDNQTLFSNILKNWIPYSTNNDVTEVNGRGTGVLVPVRGGNIYFIPISSIYDSSLN